MILSRTSIGVIWGLLLIVISKFALGEAPELIIGKENPLRGFEAYNSISRIVLHGEVIEREHPSAERLPDSKTSDKVNPAIEVVVKSYVEHGVFNGALLVAKSGEIIHNTGYGLASRERKVENSPHTKYRLASLTKSFTALLVMQLVEEGRLELSDSITKYLVELPTNKFGGISIHQLLAHTSGIPNYFELPGWYGSTYQGMSREAFLREITKLELKFPPGSGREYSNAGYFLLGRLIETLRGKPYSAVLEERILAPLDMANSGAEIPGTRLPERADGYRWASGGGYRHQEPMNIALFSAAADIYSTAEDLFRWDRGLYTDKLLTATSKSILLRPENSYGWVIEERRLADVNRPLKTISYNGQLQGFSSMITRFVDDGHSVIILDNTGMDYELKRNLTDDIAAVLYQRPAPKRKLPITFFLNRALLDGDLHAAIEACRKGVEGYEADARRLQGFARQLRWSGLNTEALAVLTLIADLFPEQPGLPLVK